MATNPNTISTSEMEGILNTLQAENQDILKAQSADFAKNAYSDGSELFYNADGDMNAETFGTNSGVYVGSLSAQGNMVAMMLNTGNINPIEDTIGASGWGQKPVTYTKGMKPYLTGYFRKYFQDPTKCTFGANSAMPALTAVMPDKYTDMPGNFLYYVDLQLTRLTGSDLFNNFYFINSFNQALGWISTTNDYIAGLKNAEGNNLAYYGSKNYVDLVTQGFNKYQQGQALVQTFNRIGKMVDSVPTGYFGTPNAVAKTLVDLGVGFIGNLTARLTNAGVNFQDIYNPVYTPIISQTLTSITNQSDLATVQQVVGSNIRVITSLLDYTNIQAVSGIPNDSAFTDLAAAGKDLYQRAPNFTFTTGSAVAAMIQNIQAEVSANVESISTTTSLLTPEIIASLRTFLPQTINNKPASLINVIGMASGYLTESMNNVNFGIARLFATSYGPTLRQLLTDITQYYGEVALSDAEAKEAESYRPMPPVAQITRENPIYGTLFNRGKNSVPVQAPGYNTYWSINLDKKKKAYLDLLNTIVNDKTGEIPDIVNQINTNYDYVCQQLYYEYKNYNKANISTTAFSDNSQIFSFVSSLPENGADPLNIGTDYLLYGMCQQNASGDLAKAILGQSKNNQILANAGVRIKGIV
jgi:hypothetical protein